MGLYRRTPTSNWIAEYVDAAGKRQRVSTKTTSKTAAQKILEQLRIDAASQRFGVTSPKVELSTLIDEYVTYLSSNGAKHRQTTEQRLRRIVDACGWTKATQITQYQVETTVRQMPSQRQGQPLSLRSQAHYLTAAKSFTKWLVHVRLVLVRDPLIAIKKPNWDGDRKLIRRFLLPAEWQWLAKTPHAVLYETAIQTGFRAGEISKLSKASLREDHLYLPAKHTKNKQAAKQYITAHLRKRLASKLPFEVPHRDYLAETLRADLEIARTAAVQHAAANKQQIPDDFLKPIDAQGHVLDFHALRHTCGAWLAMRNVNAKVIQSIMRHSSIRLTLDVYGHLMPGAEQEAIEHFDQIMHPS